MPLMPLISAGQADGKARKVIEPLRGRHVLGQPKAAFTGIDKAESWFVSAIRNPIPSQQLP